MKKGYRYASEKLSAARRALMLPHPKGEEHSIIGAFHECMLAFHDLDRSELPDDPRTWIATVERLMDTTDIPEDPNGTWLIKARQLSEEDRFDLSRTVDELAWWFSHNA